MTFLDCDYLVIGGGTAGCVVAARLSEDPDVRVVLLEAGDADGNPLLAIPGALPITGTVGRFNWSSYTEPEPEMENRRLFLSQGKVLGGGSSINGMVYTRGQPWDFDHWRDLGCTGWSYEDVLPVFRKSEASDRGASRWHGDAGPLRVTRNRSPLPIADRFLAATQAAGFALVDDLNSERQEGFGYTDVCVTGGRRNSAASAFIAPARRRKNLTVVTNALATRLMVERGRARGCAFLRHGTLETVRAAREVIVCNGAIRTPQLLMLSGIGPADELRRFGVDVVLDAPGIGANLQNHVSYKLQYAISEPITAYRYLNPFRAMASGLEYLAGRRGYLGLGPTPICGFFRSDSALDQPDMQVFMNPALFGRLDLGLYNLLPKEHGISLSLNQGRPWSRGEIRLASADPTDQPRIIGNYLSDRRDLEALARSIEIMRDLCLGPALRPIVSREILPGEPVRTRADIERHIRETAGNHFHVCGTTRMGSDGDAVVDLQLRVRGIEGLRVADASIMPTLMNGNTAAAIIMIGERAAEMIKADQARH